jgi:hypothetical protein
MKLIHCPGIKCILKKFSLQKNFEKAKIHRFLKSLFLFSLLKSIPAATDAFMCKYFIYMKKS